MKIKTGDISIVENAGTFLLWYDIVPERGLTVTVPEARLGKTTFRAARRLQSG